MKRKVTTLILILLVIAGQFTYGQSAKETAFEKCQKAIELVDNGNIDGGIKLLEEAQKLDPTNVSYPYELAYAYYMKQDYKKAVKCLENVLKHKDVDAKFYQLLGNSYDNMGNPEKAIETYEAGLKRFPNSGNLYLEMGVMQLSAKEYNKALSYFEKGIEVDPLHPSNYYWAAKLYCSSTEEVWGMIYGEIFMNLERNSKRTKEISKLLYDTYKSEITFSSDTSFSVSFSKNASIDIKDLKNPKKFKLPFGVGVYEPTLMLSMLSIKSININSLDTIRSNFIDNYFNNKHDKNYPIVLFAYQKQVKEAGHIEAYNHWILMNGDEDGFDNWQSENKEKWDSFVTWFTDNGININNKNKFYRAQYSD